MKKRNTVVLGVILAVMIAGCGQQTQTGAWKGDTNGIYVTRDLGIQEALVYTSEKENTTYNQDELKTFVEQSIVEYNTVHGGTPSTTNVAGQEKLPVALKTCTLDGKTGTVVFDYASGEDLVGFGKDAGGNTHTLSGFSVKKVSDMDLSKGTFVTAAGASIAVDEIVKQGDAVVIAASGISTVYTEGAIQYVSTGVTMQDGYVVTPEGGISYIIFK